MGNGYTRFFPKPIWRVSDVHTIRPKKKKKKIIVVLPSSGISEKVGSVGR